MQKVMVDKAKLLERLKSNREKHQEQYNEAVAKYRELVVEILTKALDDARGGGKIRTWFNVDEPHSHVKDYDTAIEWVEWSEDALVELDWQDFCRYVRDQWGWKREFHKNAMLYSSCSSSSSESSSTRSLIIDKALADEEEMEE